MSSQRASPNSVNKPATDPPRKASRGGGILVREAKEADVGAIAEIEAASFAHDAEKFPARKIRALLRNRRTHVLVAELDGKVTAWIAGIAKTRGPRPWGRIYALAVHPDARRRKLGKTLATRMIEIFVAAGATVIALEVRQGNQHATRMYQSLGFQPCKPLPNYYSPGLHAQRMILNLPAQE